MNFWYFESNTIKSGSKQGLLSEVKIDRHRWRVKK